MESNSDGSLDEEGAADLSTSGSSQQQQDDMELGQGIPENMHGQSPAKSDTETFNMNRSSYELRHGLSQCCLIAGIIVISTANFLTLVFYVRSLGTLIDDVREFTNVYLLASVSLKAFTLAAFDGFATYGGIKLLRAAERLSLPLTLPADRLQVLSGNKSGGDIHISNDLKTLLENIVKILAKN